MCVDILVDVPVPHGDIQGRGPAAGGLHTRRLQAHLEYLLLSSSQLGSVIRDISQFRVV